MNAVKRRSNSVWLILLMAVLSSNFILYRTEFGLSLLEGAIEGVVLGSMVDLAVVSPLLWMAWRGKITLKGMFSGAALGLITVRFLIPAEWLGSFAAITWIGFAAEGALLFLEILVLAALFVYLPTIIQTARSSNAPLLFSFPDSVDLHVQKRPIIQVLCSEMLMFYFAFASWRKSPHAGDGLFTLHQKSGYLALQLMLIHAIVIESIGIHWWLHDRAPILSIILLLLNVYAVILFIGDIQAVRLTPAKFAEDRIYLSLGLMKRMEVRFSDIAEILQVEGDPEMKAPKNAIEFIPADFGPAPPHVILRLNRPAEAVLVMGIRRKYDQVHIRADEPGKFIEELQERTGKLARPSSVEVSEMF
ncbi:hypothetical protein [Bhargavaea cecembensis]|uniref:hypothetical protein n=1 Tax=Bhargavaea cecembensis TaxID=394098 RepID=UPI00058CF8B4|nr:hypothetical protein [Bhargavaea cecembensis]